MRMGAETLLGRKFEPIWARFERWCVFFVHSISDKTKAAMHAQCQCFIIFNQRFVFYL